MPPTKTKAKKSDKITAPAPPLPVTLEDIIPELQQVVEDDSHRRLRLGLRVSVNDVKVFAGNPSNILAYFAGETPTRDAYYVVHNGLINRVLREYKMPLPKLQEFMEQYG